MVLVYLFLFFSSGSEQQCLRSTARPRVLTNNNKRFSANTATPDYRIRHETRSIRCSDGREATHDSEAAGIGRSQKDPPAMRLGWVGREDRNQGSIVSDPNKKQKRKHSLALLDAVVPPGAAVQMGLACG